MHGPCFPGSSTCRRRDLLPPRLRPHAPPIWSTITPHVVSPIGQRNQATAVKPVSSPRVTRTARSGLFDMRSRTGVLGLSLSFRSVCMTSRCVDLPRAVVDPAKGCRVAPTSLSPRVVCLVHEHSRSVYPRCLCAVAAITHSRTSSQIRATWCRAGATPPIALASHLLARGVRDLLDAEVGLVGWNVPPSSSLLPFVRRHSSLC